MDELKSGRVGSADQALVSDQAASRLDPTGFDPSRISDEQLVEACCPGEPPEDKARFLAALTADHRATLKRMIWASDELNAGRIPPGVIACKRVGRIR